MGYVEAMKRLYRLLLGALDIGFVVVVLVTLVLLLLRADMRTKLRVSK